MLPQQITHTHTHKEMRTKHGGLFSWFSTLPMEYSSFPLPQPSFHTPERAKPYKPFPLFFSFSLPLDFFLCFSPFGSHSLSAQALLSAHFLRNGRREGVWKGMWISYPHAKMIASPPRDKADSSGCFAFFTSWPFSSRYLRYVVPCVCASADCGPFFFPLVPPISFFSLNPLPPPSSLMLCCLSCLFFCLLLHVPVRLRHSVE